MKRFDDLQQVRCGTSEAINSDHHQHVSGPSLLDGLGQQRTLAVVAGRILLVDDRAASRPQCVHLRTGCLIVGRDTGISDQVGRTLFAHRVLQLLTGGWKIGGLSNMETIANVRLVKNIA